MSSQSGLPTLGLDQIRHCRFDDRAYCKRNKDKVNEDLSLIVRRAFGAGFQASRHQVYRSAKVWIIVGFSMSLQSFVSRARPAGNLYGRHLVGSKSQASSGYLLCRQSLLFAVHGRQLTHWLSAAAPFPGWPPISFLAVFPLPARCSAVPCIPENTRRRVVG